MAICVECRQREGEYKNQDWEPLCGKCADGRFQCPGCKRVFPHKGFDSGNGFCDECSTEKED